MYLNSRYKNMKKSKKNILVFGMPRSGTTWIGKIFDSHPDTLYLHEPDTEEKITELPRFVRPNQYKQYQQFTSEYVQQLTNKTSLRVNGKLPLFNKHYCSPILNLFLKLNIYVAKFIEQTNLKIGLINYIKFLKDKTYIIVWKSIESMARVGLLLEADKDLKLVYIIRHPCGQIASVLAGEKKKYFSSSAPISEDFAYFEALSDIKLAEQQKYTLDDVRAMTQVQKLALRWAMINDQAIEAIENYAERAIVVRYEDFCTDPVKKTKQVFKEMELPWNKKTEHFLGGIDQESESYYSVKKIPEKAMNKWKEQLTTEEITEIKDIVLTSKSGQLFERDF